MKYGKPFSQTIYDLMDFMIKNMYNVRFTKYGCGCRFEGKILNHKGNMPQAYSINWHYTKGCFELIEYFENTGKHYYYNTFMEVQEHFASYKPIIKNNLWEYNNYVQKFVDKLVAEKI